MSLIQLGLYYVLKRYNSTIPDFLVILPLLACYFIVLPYLFSPEPSKDGINCAMPALAITLGFWIYGTLATICTHILWVIKKRIDLFYAKQDFNIK